MTKKYKFIDTEKEDVEKIHSQIEKCFNCKYFYVHSFKGRYSISKDEYQAVKISCPFRNDGAFYMDCEHFEDGGIRISNCKNLTTTEILDLFFNSEFLRELGRKCLDEEGQPNLNVSKGMIIEIKEVPYILKISLEKELNLPQEMIKNG